MNQDTQIPAKYTDMVGQSYTFSGPLFGYSKKPPEAEYTVLGARWGSARVMNVKQMMEKGESDYEYPTVEFLIKNEGMKRSRWTIGFPVRKINLKALAPQP